MIEELDSVVIEVLEDGREVERTCVLTFTDAQLLLSDLRQIEPRAFLGIVRLDSDRLADRSDPDLFFTPSDRAIVLGESP